MRKWLGKPENIFTFIGAVFTGLGIVFVLIAAVSGITFFRLNGQVRHFPDMLPFFLTFAVVGSVFTIVGLAFLIHSKRQKNKRKQLMESGERLFAEITGGYLDYSLRINGRYPYRLECRYEDPFSGESYLYRSGPVWFDPSLFTGQQVTVYANRNDRSIYYVDTDFLGYNGQSASAVHDYR